MGHEEKMERYLLISMITQIVTLVVLIVFVIVAVTVIIPTLDDIESNTDTLNEDKSAGKEFRRITKEIKELDDDFAWLAGVLANALDYDFSNLTIALHNDFHNYLNGAAGLLASIDNGVAQVAANTA